MPSQAFPKDSFDRIQEMLLQASAGRHRLDLVALGAELNELREQYRNVLESTQAYAAKIEELDEAVKKLTEPPLLHALLIGKSGLKEGAFVISVGGQRFDVGVGQADGQGVDAEQLVEGQEVLVTRQDHTIVGVLGLGRRGECASVLDVLRGAEPGQPERLLVRLGGSDGIIVDMAEALLRLPEKIEPTADEEQDGEDIYRRTRPRAGDKVLVDVAAKIAFEKLPSHETVELELEKDPRDCYSDIAGLDDKIDLIKDAIEMPYLYRERFKAYDLKRPRGILLHGPPGCGKTMIGRAVANGLKQRIIEQLDDITRRLEMFSAFEQGRADAATLALLREGCPEAFAEGVAREAALALLAESLLENVPRDLDVKIDLRRLPQTIEALRVRKRETRSYFINVKGPELLSKWVGEAESRVRQIFTEARRKASYTRPVVVFFDEIESMFQRRGSGVSTDMEKTMVPQLLTELDGVVELENVVIIGASNRHELLDPALMRPGRLDIKIKIDRPDRAAASSIFKLYLRPDLPLSADGLAGVSSSSFTSELVRALKGLGEGVSYLAVRSAGGGQVLLRLSALPEYVLEEVADYVREKAGARAAAGQRRLRYADLAEAVQRVCLERRARLAAEQLFPADAEEVLVVLSLDAAEQALDAAALPGLPLALSLPSANGEALAGPLSEKDAARLSELMSEFAVETLYSPHSVLSARVLAPCRREHSFMLREFVSGALISNVVARAKRLALKSETRRNGNAAEADGDGAGERARGITCAALLQAIRDEYEENKEQFIANKPEVGGVVCGTCKRAHSTAEEYATEVRLGRGSQDRWQLPRQRPFD